MTQNTNKKSTPIQLSLDEDQIPVDGALGLLAYGDIALTAWRNKRTQMYGHDWREKLARELADEAKALQEKTQEKQGEQN
jgi:hypothetical protein